MVKIISEYHWLLFGLVKCAIMLGFFINAGGLLTIVERRQMAVIQDRIGPNRAGHRARPGPQGPAADAPAAGGAADRRAPRCSGPRVWSQVEGAAACSPASPAASG